MKSIINLTILTLMLISCSKTRVEINQNVNITKLKEWYHNEKVNNPGNDNLISDELQIGEVDWDNVAYFPESNLYRVPLTEDAVNPRLGQYLLLHEDINGHIISGEFAFILLKDTISNLNKDQILLLFPRIESFQNMPEQLQASMIKYNLNGDRIYSSSVKNSIVNYSNEKIIFNQKSLSLPTCQNEVCIDWYWVVFDENGEVSTETFLYTICMCNDISGGGAGGNGGSSTNACLNQTNTFMSQGHACFIPISNQVISSNSNEMTKRYSWKAFTAGSWGLISYETGKIKNVPLSSGGFIREYVDGSFAHTSLVPIGVNIGGTRTATDLGAIFNYTPWWVNEVLDFSIVSTVAGCSSVTQNWQSVADYRLSNNIVIE
jgi:hypothetical protein